MKQRLKVPCIHRQEGVVSILQKEIMLVGTRARQRHIALFDSGASYSIIRRDIAEALQPLSPLADLEEWVFETARPGELIAAKYSVGLGFRFDDSEALFHDEFFVFDECSEEVIIGAKTLQSCHIVLDFENEQIVYRKTAERLRV